MSEWRQHPHLYFNAEKLSSIRKKTAHPRFKADWEAVRFQAEQSLGGPLIDRQLPENSYLCTTADQAAGLAFVYSITGERRYAERARAMLDALIEIPQWTGNPVDCPFGLREGAMSLHLALAYDLLASEFSDADRRTFVDACRKRLIDVFIENCKSGENRYLSGQRTMNHLALHASGATCLTLALDGDGVDLSLEIEIARAHLLRFIEWYDDAGASLENGSYWAYANEHVLRALVALRENGWKSIFHQRAKKLNRFMYPILCMSIGGKFITNFADSFYGFDLTETRENHLVKKAIRERTLTEGTDARHTSYRMRTCALAVAAEFQDGRLQWFADQMPHGDEFGLICGDPELPATPPDDLPTTILYHGTGIGVLRSSMTDPNAIFLGVKAGRGRGKHFDDPHCQFDLNSIVLEAYGTSLLADPGYHHVWHTSMSTTDPNHISNSTPPHNTLLVDGSGQTVEDNPVAHLQDLSPNDEIDYVVSRIERGYGLRLQRFDRHVYFINKSFFVVVDDVQLRDRGVLTWNFHSPEDARLEVNVPRITRGRASLTIAPFGAPLKCCVATDHLLPRLQFDTPEPVASSRTGWLLLPHLKDEKAPAISAVFTSNGVKVKHGAKEWELPVVVRRGSFCSDLMLPYPERAEGGAVRPPS